MKRETIEQLLPDVFRAASGAGRPLGALLGAMEILHAPSERLLESLDEIFDPRRAPERMVHHLAVWVDLGRLRGAQEGRRLRPSAGTRTADLEPGCLRELVAHAAALSRVRGTERGLVLFLTLATGVRGFRVESGLEEFQIRVRAPERARAHEALIRHVVELEKPAHVRYALEWVEQDAPPERDG